MNNLDYEIYQDTELEKALLEASDNENISEEKKNELINTAYEVQLSTQEKIIKNFDYYEKLSMYGKAIDDKVKALRDRKQRCTKAASKFKEAVLLFLNTHDLKSIEWAQHKIHKSHSVATIIDDESLLDGEYVKIVTSPDKTAIKKAIKSGMPVDGAHLEEKEHLVVK